MQFPMATVKKNALYDFAHDISALVSVKRNKCRILLFLYYRSKNLHKKISILDLKLFLQTK
jgi:hypothetical protein